MMQRSAILDDSKACRHTLERIWDDTKEQVLFIMLNPSIADGNTADATIKRCMTFAGGGDCGGIIVGNLLALRSTDPRAWPTTATPRALKRWPPAAAGQHLQFFQKAPVRHQGVVQSRDAVAWEPTRTERRSTP